VWLHIEPAFIKIGVGLKGPDSGDLPAAYGLQAAHTLTGA